MSWTLFLQIVILIVLSSIAIMLIRVCWMDTK